MDIYEDETAESTEGEAIDSAPEGGEAGEATTEEAVETAPVEESAPIESTPADPEFDFSGWGGEVEELPEHYRPIHEHVSGHLKKEIDGLRNSLEQDRELYQALLEGEDVGKDFRDKLDQAQKELAKHEKTKGTWETEKAEYDEKIKHFETRMAEAETLERAEADRWARQFRQDNADIFDDTAKQEYFSKLMESGLDPELAVEFVRVDNPKYTQSTLGYLAQGVPSTLAMRLAQSDIGLSQTQAAEPRASAQITAGATEAANVPDSAEKSVSDNTISIKDARRLAAHRAFKRRVG
jgi:hypothetical protein